jgi:hypothetical protein
MLRGVIILIALGGCWALLGDQTTWPSWQSIATTVSSWMNRSAPEPIEPAALAMATTSAPARAEPPTKPAALDANPRPATTRCERRCNRVQRQDRLRRNRQ